MLNPTNMLKRSINKPVKFTMRASWLCPSVKNMNCCAKPVSAVKMIIKKMATPKKTCQGAKFALVDIWVPGEKKAKKPNSHCENKFHIS